MKRTLLLLSGAAGILLAALFYWLAMENAGVLKFLILISEAAIVIFLLLLAVALLEIGVMSLVLVKFATALPLVFLCLIAAGYVAFAGVYALFYALLVPDPLGIQVLAALCLVRWFMLFFVKVS